jgi:hypothetical protein
VIPHPRSSNPAIHTIYEFSNETWVENTAVRSNSNLLLNILSTPSFYELNPFDSTPGSARLLHTFSFATGLGGIAEIQPDGFAVVAGNWSITTFDTTPSSCSVWKADFNYPDRKDLPFVSKIADLPKASFLNGMTLLAPRSPYLLVADSTSVLFGASTISPLNTKSFSNHHSCNQCRAP